MMLKSAVFIIPDQYVELGNSFAEQLGWGSRSLSVPLSPTGESPATHWGARADVGPGFLELVTDPEPEMAELLEQLVMDIEDSSDAYGHWSEVLKSQGLKMVTIDQ
jgi:hypothetical protein